MADRFLEWLVQLPTVPLYAIIVVLSAVENVFPPVPADVALALGAFLATRGAVSAPLLGLVCWLANVSTSWGLYFYARSRREAFLRSAWAQRFMPPAVMRALQEAYAKHGVLGIFVSRFLPGVRSAVTPFAGVAGMPPVKVLVPAATASAIWYAAVVTVASYLGLNWGEIKQYLAEAGRVLGIAALLALVALLYWLWRRSRAGE